MTSSRPYLIRALYEWLVDNGVTPHLLVDVEDESVVVPRDFVEDGRIVLNINPTAVHELELGNEWITFNARFNGSPMDVVVPITAVLGIYARENGQGMLFPQDSESEETAGSPADDEPDPTSPKGRPSLKLVK